MTILEPGISIGNIVNFIPKELGNITSIQFTDEETNTGFLATNIVTTYNSNSYYSSVEFDLGTTLIEGRFYMMRLLIGILPEVSVYYDKVFCTSQDPNTFSVNNGVYLNAPGTQNEYIIYEQ